MNIYLVYLAEGKTEKQHVHKIAYKHLQASKMYHCQETYVKSVFLNSKMQLAMIQ